MLGLETALVFVLMTLGTALIVFRAWSLRQRSLGRIAPRAAEIDRSGDFRKSAAFVDLRARVWDLLREEVLKARAQEEDAEDEEDA